MESAKNEEVVPRQKYTNQNTQKQGIKPPKSGKKCSNTLQKIRQHFNTTINFENGNRKQTNQPQIAHDIYVCMPKNAAIS